MGTHLFGSPCTLHRWIVCDPNQNTIKIHNFDGCEKLHWSKLTEKMQ